MDQHGISKILDELPAQIAWRRPDSIVIDAPYWFQVITPSSKLIPLNGVYRSIISPEDIDAKIKETIEEFGRYQTPFRWLITGSARPMDLATRLEMFNFKKDGEALGLAADAFEILGSGDPGIQVVELTAESIDEWVDAAVDGWGNPDSFRSSLRTDITRALHEQGHLLRYFSAVVDNKIVGTGTLRFCDKSAHLLGSCVRSEFRGRGIYRALVHKRAKVAIDRGLNLITTHGKVDTSAPVLRRIGFRHFGEMAQYNFEK